jgi:glycosyltransferase involved in cell wall biosynthesis
MMSPQNEQVARLRLLVLGRSLEHEHVGGIVYVSRQLLAHLDEQRFDVSYFANGAGRTGVLGGVVRLLTLPMDLVRAWRRQSSFRPDVIHINTSLDWRSLLRDSCFLMLVRIRCDRVVLFIHGWQWKLGTKIQTKGHPLRWFCRRVFGRARHVIVLSRSFADVVRDLEIPGERVHVVPNPVDCSAFPRPSAATRSGDEGTWRLLFLARLVAEKGIYELIESMPGLLRACERPVELVVAGEGPERESAGRRCRELGVGDAVVFPGYVTGAAKRELYENSHLFVFPSHREAFPIVLLEALAVGLPLVTTRVGAIEEFVRDSEHGVLLSDGSSAEIERGVLSLLSDPQRLAEIGHDNREYARQRFDSPHVARMLEEIYRC